MGMMIAGTVTRAVASTEGKPVHCTHATSSGWLSNGLTQIANATMRGVKYALREPGKAVVIGLSVLAGVRSVAAAPLGGRVVALREHGSAMPVTAADDPWTLRAQAIGKEVGDCMRSRHIDGLEPRLTEAHCMGQVVFDHAMNRQSRPDEIREMARVTPDLGSPAGQYVALAQRGMHMPVTLPYPDTVQDNIDSAARLVLALPNVRDRINEDARTLVASCNMQERVDNDNLGEPGLFTTDDVVNAVHSEACSDGVLRPPMEHEVRQANAAQFHQTTRVKDEQAFATGQYRIHKGEACVTADANYENRVVSKVIDFIRF